MYNSSSHLLRAARTTAFLSGLLLLLAQAPSMAAPGDTLFYDNLNGNLSNWTVVASGGNASIGNEASNQGRALRLRWGVVNIYTDPIDANVGGARLDLWIRRGSNSFSNYPETGENLIVEYRNSSNAWIVLDTFLGGGTAGQIYTPSYTLPAAALHANLSIRFRMTAGNGSNFDYWHLDDVRVTELAGNAPILYSFEETAWTGVPGEVVDGSGAGLNGTVYGGATNASTTPARATNPGTCRYGQFDGVNDYIEIADNAALDIANELTVAAWVRMRTLPTELHTIVSKDTNYEFHIDDQGRVYWWWEVSNFRTNGFSITLNQWHHIAITYRSGSQTIYVDGVSRATNSYVGTLPQNNLSVFIGTDYNLISRAFDGDLDEVYILPKHSTQAEVQALRDATHPCATAAAQFTINHDNFGIHCLPETITVNVVDSIAGTPLNNYNAPVQLDTQTTRGTWTKVSGSGSFSDATADDGLAVYNWPLGESQAIFQLSYTQGAPLMDVDVFQISNPGIRDTDAEGNLIFSANGFTLTAAQLSNPPPGVIVSFNATQTAGIPFDVHISAYGQTPNDPVCGIIESYTGPKNLKFWSQYLNPSSGSVAVQIGTPPGTAIAVTEGAAVNRSVTFSNGRASVVANYKDAGSMQILVKDDTTVNADLPGGIRGATAGFVVKPYDFVVSDVRNAAGTVTNPGANDSDGLRFIAAGAPFRATVQAVDFDGDPTPNYGRESIPETVRLVPQLFDPSWGNNPAVGAVTGFGAFSGGAATGFDFSWSEVGIIDVTGQVWDSDYLGAGNVIGATVERVGRFFPDHLVAEPSIGADAPMFQTACAGPGGFTYTGQAFHYLVPPVLTVTAKNAAGNTTVNYTDGFFKLTTAGLQNRSYTSTAGTLDATGVPPASADPVVVPLPFPSGAGTATFSSGSGLLFTRGVAETPFDAEIQLSVNVVDSDGVAALGPAVFSGTGSGILFNSSNEVRYGRMRFVNAYGSENVNLPVPLIAEYYMGPAIGFVANVDDTCTTSVSVAFDVYTGNLADGETCALDSGAPGSSGIGCAIAAPLSQQFKQPPVGGDFNLTLRAPGAGNTGSVSMIATVPDHLKFDWDAAAAGDEHPSGLATFGLYGGESRQIYLRETFN